MHPVVLSLAIHNHQPVGNFDHIMARATDNAYAPLVGALERHPRIRLALHYSGPLLDWLKPHRPDLLQRIRALAARGQVEILTGGYYEPILAAIPDADKRGQIEKLTRTITAEFGSAPEGLWLAERVWEPHLPRVLSEAGVEYVLVDDRHFALAGLDTDALGGYYLTDEQGASLRVFPISQPLRYLIPFADVDKTLEYLDGRRGSVSALTMVDDGEK
ncbi:MAG: 4-alpha-glucanotransferase, partial [Bacillati bacterium ANGP1]